MIRDDFGDLDLWIWMVLFYLTCSVLAGKRWYGECNTLVVSFSTDPRPRISEDAEA